MGQALVTRRYTGQRPHSCWTRVCYVTVGDVDQALSVPGPVVNALDQDVCFSFGFLTGSRQPTPVRMAPRGLVYRGLVMKRGAGTGPSRWCRAVHSLRPGLAVSLQAGGHQSMKKTVWPTEGLLDHMPGWKGPLRRYGSSC